MAKIFSKTKGIVFDKSFLEEIAEKDLGETYAGFFILDNSPVFQRIDRTDYEVVMEKGGEYFKFNYIVHFGEKSIGKFNPDKFDKNDLGKKYFCEKLNSVSHVY